MENAILSIFFKQPLRHQQFCNSLNLNWTEWSKSSFSPTCIFDHHSEYQKPYTLCLIISFNLGELILVSSQEVRLILSLLQEFNMFARPAFQKSVSIQVVVPVLITADSCSASSGVIPSAFNIGLSD